MVNTSFVNRGSDDALVKSLQEQGLVPEELSKAIDKSKLVQVEIQVQGKNGTFTRKQWKKAGDVKSTDRVVGGQQPQGEKKLGEVFKRDQIKIDGSGVDKFITLPDGTALLRSGFAGKKYSTFDSVTGKSTAQYKATDGMMYQTTTEVKNGFNVITQVKRVVDYEAAKKQMQQDRDDIAKKKAENNSKKLQPLSPDQKKAADKMISDLSHKSKSDTTKSWQDKINAGKFSEAEKKALSYGVSEKHACLMEKDGKYTTAKTYDEADYATKQGWTNLGSITQIISDGKVKSSISLSDSLRKVTLKDSYDMQEMKEATKTIQQNLEDIEKHKRNRLQGKTGAINGSYSKEEQEAIDKQHELNAEILRRTKKPAKSNHFEVPKTKDAIQKLVSSGVSKKDIMEQAKASGVTWKHNDHEGINWMRCCMAMTGTTTKGGKKS